MTFLIWYLFGVVGTCIITYFDARHGYATRDDHMLVHLLFSLLGLIMFGYSLACCYWEYSAWRRNQ